MKLFDNIVINKGIYEFYTGRIIKMTNTHYLIESNQPFYSKKSKLIQNRNIKWFKHNDVDVNTNDWFITKQRDIKLKELLNETT